MKILNPNTEKETLNSGARGFLHLQSKQTNTPAFDFL